MHHHHGGETCGLRTEPTGSEIHGDEARFDCHAHLLDGEVALWAYQHQGIVTLLTAQFIEELGTGDLVVAMGDIARTFLMGCDELLEGDHLMEHRLPGFAALFHG